MKMIKAEPKDILRSLAKAEGLSVRGYARLLGVPTRSLEKSIERNSATAKVVEALNRYYKTDYSFLFVYARKR